MPELNEEHFELHDQNKAERYERQKIKFLEDRITTLEKSIERLNKIVSIWKLGQEENNDPFIKVMEQGEKDYELI